MAMTVRKLIAELKKMPANAKVCWCDHDQDYNAGEFNGPVCFITDAPPAIRERGYGVILS